jgi:hypothetical protein
MKTRSTLFAFHLRKKGFDFDGVMSEVKSQADEGCCQELP